MSRSSRATTSSMGPPQDIVMGPPPLPSQLANNASQTGAQNPGDSTDINDKYRRLKRKVFDLEEKHKEAMLELRKSGERNLKWRHERALLLDRITELETNHEIATKPNIPDFHNNLRLAAQEYLSEDPDIDPLILSRHVGPQARKRQEEEMKERQEEEAREQRRAARKPRNITSQKSKDIGAPLTYAPAQNQSNPSSSASGVQPHNPSPILVSSTGTRLRLKPPAPPTDPQSNMQISESQSPVSGSSARQHAHGRRSESPPMSPVMSPQDEFAPSMSVNLSAHTPSYLPHPISQAQAQMQMTLRPSNRPSDLQRQAKPKRLKAHTVTSKSFSIPTVPRNAAGHPLLPLNVGIMTVLNLGEICMREHFHTERYIFPVGYEVTRRYFSTTDPNAETVYICTILDGGDGPKFQIVASDVPDKPVIAGTATGAWSVIVRSANHIRERQHSNSVSGPDFFGLGQNTIKHLIQELPGADRLKDYVWQTFQEGGQLGGRHAAVIPALPEEESSGTPSPFYPDGSEYERERPREMQMMQVDHDDREMGEPSHAPPPARPRGAHAPPPPPNAKPMVYHHEYAQPVDAHRWRPTRFDEEQDSPRQRRQATHSPAMHRDEGYPPPQLLPSSHQEHPYAHPDAHRHAHAHSRSHSNASSPPQQHRSPYRGEAPFPPRNGRDRMDPGARHYHRSPTSPHAVPTPFADIMHAYTASPMGAPGSAEAAGEYAYANGGGRRNGNGNGNGTGHGYSPRAPER